jgi:hypothetical protein
MAKIAIHLISPDSPRGLSLFAVKIRPPVRWLAVRTPEISEGPIMEGERGQPGHDRRPSGRLTPAAVHEKS